MAVAKPLQLSPLFLLQDVFSLSRLPKLIRLGLNEPKYGANPISLLCNYTTQVLYHLPNLQRLDGHDITNKPYKALAEVCFGQTIYCLSQ